MKVLKSVVVLLILSVIITGCSDEGDSPTGPSNGTPPLLSISNVTVTEGAVATLNVTLSKSGTADVIFTYASTPGTAVAADYTPVTGTKTIAAGATSTTIDITTIDDSDVEPTESFSLVLSSIATAFTNDDSVGVVTITDNDQQPVLVSFDSEVKPIIQSRCAITACHGSGFSQGGMTLGSGSYNSVVNASGDNGMIVVSGNANASNLYLKVTSTPPFGARMPFGGAALSTAEQNIIRDWINEGAQDN